jgi:adenine specific DNA methylase Mod
MQKVIDGTDQGGISKAVNWKGGGGFRYIDWHHRFWKKTSGQLGDHRGIQQRAPG